MKVNIEQLTSIIRNQEFKFCVIKNADNRGRVAQWICETPDEIILEIKDWVKQFPYNYIVQLKGGQTSAKENMHEFYLTMENPVSNNSVGLQGTGTWGVQQDQMRKTIEQEFKIKELERQIKDGDTGPPSAFDKLAEALAIRFAGGNSTVSKTGVQGNADESKVDIKSVEGKIEQAVNLLNKHMAVEQVADTLLKLAKAVDKNPGLIDQINIFLK